MEVKEVREGERGRERETQRHKVGGLTGSIRRGRP